MKEPQQNANPRVNSFSKAPSSYQVLSYMLLISQMAIYYTCVQPLING